MTQIFEIAFESALRSQMKAFEDESKLAIHTPESIKKLIISLQQIAYLRGVNNEVINQHEITKTQLIILSKLFTEIYERQNEI